MSVPFSLASGLIVVSATVFGPQGNRAIRLALDTGATETAIRRRILAIIGIDTLTAPTVPAIMGGGMISVPLVTVDALESLGQTQTGVTIQAHTLPASLPIDGLLGLDFISKGRLVVNFRTGRISLK